MVLGDVTYGACCVDDLSAGALGAQLLVHYGHSCLVPVGETTVPCMYVFVDIKVDVPHLVETVRRAGPLPALCGYGAVQKELGLMLVSSLSWLCGLPARVQGSEAALCVE